jgi:hypothetical protein
MQIKIPPRIFLIASLGIIACLSIMNFLGMYGTFVLGKLGGYGLIDMFTLNAEANVPTYFSTALLLAAAVLLALVAKSSKMRNSDHFRHWSVLSGLCLFLSLDEFAQIHELLDEHRGWSEGLFDASGALVGPWVVLYGGLALLVLSLFARFFWQLPKKYKLIFGIAAAMFLTAAIGIEMFGATVWESEGASWRFELINSIEEIFEMTSITILITGLLMYLEEHSSRLTITFGAANPG